MVEFVSNFKRNAFSEFFKEMHVAEPIPVCQASISPVVFEEAKVVGTEELSSRYRKEGWEKGGFY